MCAPANHPVPGLPLIAASICSTKPLCLRASDLHPLPTCHLAHVPPRGPAAPGRDDRPGHPHCPSGARAARPYLPPENCSPLQGEPETGILPADDSIQVSGLGHRVSGSGFQVQVQVKARTRTRGTCTRIPVTRDLRPENVCPSQPSGPRSPFEFRLSIWPTGQLINRSTSLPSSGPPSL